MISKLLRLYKRTYGLKQICNIAVYIAHSACTIHLLNLPEKNAARDIVHGLKHLEEIAEGWLCARRTLSILDTVARRWKVLLPEEATKVLLRTKTKFGLNRQESGSPKSNTKSTMAEEQNHLDPATNNPSLSLAVHSGDPSNGTSQKASPVLKAELRRHDEAIPSSPQLATDFEQLSGQPRLILPQAQQELWNGARTCQGAVAQAETSPSMLFGGVESLVEESQDWWLKDQTNIFDNWYGTEQEAALMANGVFNDFAYSGLRANNYGLNGGECFAPPTHIV